MELLVALAVGTAILSLVAAAWVELAASASRTDRQMLAVARLRQALEILRADLDAGWRTLVTSAQLDGAELPRLRVTPERVALGPLGAGVVHEWVRSETGWRWLRRIPQGDSGVLGAASSGATTVLILDGFDLREESRRGESAGGESPATGGAAGSGRWGEHGVRDIPLVRVQPAPRVDIPIARIAPSEDVATPCHLAEVGAGPAAGPSAWLSDPSRHRFRRWRLVDAGLVDVVPAAPPGWREGYLLVVAPLPSAWIVSVAGVEVTIPPRLWVAE